MRACAQNAEPTFIIIPIIVTSIDYMFNRSER